MKRLFVISVFIGFVMGTNYAQTLDLLTKPFSDKKLSGTIDDSFLAFKGTPDLSKVLKNPAEIKDKDQLLKFALHDSFGMEGFVTSSPLDNMPVLRPTGNFPNRNFIPDPNFNYPMRVYKPHFTHTVTLDK